MTRQEACLALNLIPQIGPVRARKLIAAFGGPEQVLKASARDLTRVEGIGEAHAQAVAGWEAQVDLPGELAKVKARGITLLTETDELFPPSLRGLRDAPLLLYVWGQLLPRDHHAIGIVGSRHATVYGLSATKRLGYQIAFAGRTVISGLARGIDTAAHEAALAAKGRTIAVIGSGIGKLYPPENQALAGRIAQSGAVVSEYPVDRIADKQTFPYRNRIVAGWSAGMLVVEAPARSGALITAQQAVDNGRTVYAVPGPIDKPTSQGCNRLIQQGAKLVIEAEDILADLDTLFPPAHIPQDARADNAPPAAPPVSLDEEIVLKAVKDGAAHIDEIITASGLTPATVNVCLMRLEMKRLLRALPGRCYEAAGSS
ncbi:MAG TPA: DNA-processing protein DprA [Prosthecobacter sp.]|nr:DNA-processing protein DprA [Prosthecobacter sp.]